MGRVETIETLTIMGGLLAVIGSLGVITRALGTLWYWSYIWSPFSLWMLIALVIAWAVGLVGGVIALISYALVRDSPETAGWRTIMLGMGILIVSLLSPLNLVLLPPGLLLLAAGYLCEDLWGRILWARRQTGFPLSSVATTHGGPWHRRLSCRFCGAPLVVLHAKARGPKLIVRTVCPLDGVTEEMNLPLSQMEEWIPVLGDRLHRCARCGERTTSLIPVRSAGMDTWLKPLCPVHHTHGATRKVWTPLYYRVAGNPGPDPGFRRATIYPHTISPAIQTIPTRIPWRQNVVSITHPTGGVAHGRLYGGVESGRIIRFCHNCGVRVEPEDVYCFNCGERLKGR